MTELSPYKLGCLLGETWLEEDDLMDYWSFVPTPVFPKPGTELPRAILLPTSFLADAVVAYGSEPRLYTPEIAAVRHRLSSGSGLQVAMGFVTNNHFVAFVDTRGSPTIIYGDSMHNPPPAYMLPIFQWVFADISITQSTIQGLGIGEGSCGIAAYNFMERAVTTRQGLKTWTGQHSRTFRNVALEDLVRMHHLAHEQGGTFGDWAICKVQPGSTAVSTIATGYNDFNMYAPTVCNFFL